MTKDEITTKTQLTMNIKYLSRNYKGLGSAGNKAKTDIERIMDSMGFGNAGLARTTSKNRLAHFALTLAGVLKAPFCIRRGDVLVLQYPLKKYYTLMCRAAHLRGAQVVTVIHDLGSFRRKALTPGKEMRRLNRSDSIIAHNDSMKTWLEEHGCRARLHTLGIFDYLSDTCAPEARPRRQPYTIVYAGALNPRKNTFLYRWGGSISSYRVRLYGGGFDIRQAEGAGRFEAMGFVRSDELIANVQGDFGLVWDGTSLDGCTGDWGEYLKINNPHKTSLYIRCGLPVIIWREAALAPFVRNNGIGLCISSLRELDRILAEMTPKQYEAMRVNVEKVSRRMAEGHYFKTAIGKALGAMRE